jgi:predicted site-specific integrase-resolvase
MNDLVATRQAARRCGVSMPTFSRYVSEGRITPAFRGSGPKGQMAFHRADVEALREERLAEVLARFEEEPAPEEAANATP